MNLSKLQKSIQRVLGWLAPIDLHDHEGKPTPNELAFKLLVMAELAHMGLHCKSEVDVEKDDGTAGRVDIYAVDRDSDVCWLIELKYYSLAYWFTEKPYLDKQMDVWTKADIMKSRTKRWVDLDPAKRLTEKIVQPNADKESLNELEDHQYRDLSPQSTAFNLEVLLERARKQVRNYQAPDWEEEDVRRCIVVGVGPTCVVEKLRERMNYLQ